jgi:hypothetical protein
MVLKIIPSAAQSHHGKSASSLAYLAADLPKIAEIRHFLSIKSVSKQINTNP